MYKNTNTHYLTAGLVTGSLLLLLIFIFSWLNSSYNEERHSLEKDIQYLFSDAIHAIEDSLVHKVFLRDLTVKVEATQSDSIFIGHKRRISRDTNKVFSYIRKQEFTPLPKDSNLQVFVTNVSGNNSFDHSMDLLPILLHLDNNVMDINIGSGVDSFQIVNMINSRFKRYAAEADLPIQYDIVKLDENEQLTGLLTKVYTDPRGGFEYAAHFKGYQIYLIQRIIPQILFCLLLMGFISASFYVMFSNWKKQQQLITIKNEFISNVTHELKTPISTVGVALEALSNFDALKDPVRTVDYIKISQHELNRLNILVNKVLKMSIFEKGSMRLKIEEMDVKELVVEILNSMKIQFDKFNAKVEFETKGKDFQIEGDKIHLTNVIYNLLDNALKYCQNQPSINIVLENHDESVDIKIRDKGIGIPSQFISKIFDRFFRVPDGDRHNVKGHGLGLNYVANVIQQHHGTIQVDSDLGKGTQFNISIPRKYVES